MARSGRSSVIIRGNGTPPTSVVPPSPGAPIPPVCRARFRQNLLAAGVIPNPYWETQSILSEWVANRHWEYRRNFSPPEEMRGKHITLVLEGIDPGGLVVLNGRRLAEENGQFSRLEVDVSEWISFTQPNVLQVFVREAPAHQNQYGATDRETIPHTRFTYQWDFGTRYPMVGIWKSVRLLAMGKQRMLDVWVRPRLNLQDNAAAIPVIVTLMSGGEPYELLTSLYLNGELLGTERTRHGGATSLQEITHEHLLSDPKLWWPNGYGEPTLYRMVTEVISADGTVSDRREVVFGIREIHYLRNEGAPANAFPYTLVINGTHVFLKGWDFVPVDHLYGKPNFAKKRRLLEMMHDAGGNIVRVWGGGIIETWQFYSYCNELGLLVWQDFIQNRLRHQQRPLGGCPLPGAMGISRANDHPQPPQSSQPGYLVRRRRAAGSRRQTGGRARTGA